MPHTHRKEAYRQSENQKWRIRKGFENGELLNWRFLFGQKVWHSTDAYRKVIWRCNSKFKGKSKCATPHLSIDTIQKKFLFAYNELMKNRDGLIADCEMMRQTISDCTAVDAEIEQLAEEISVVAEMVKACVRENASSAQSQEDYEKKYNGLVKRYEKATARIDALTGERARKQDRDRELRLFIESLKTQPLLLENGTKGCGWGYLRKRRCSMMGEWFLGSRMVQRLRSGFRARPF